MFETITPIDNSVLVKREYATEEDIEKSLSNSYSVREHWKNISLEERKKSVLNFVEIFLKNKDVSSNLCKQIGRPIAQCPGEMRGFEERARYMIENADRALSRVVSIKNDEFDNYINKEPLGTIFVIAPWNYPFNTSVNSIVPSLLAGNAVILKHSSQTPLCAEELYQAAKQSSLPKNIFQYLHLDLSLIHI